MMIKADTKKYYDMDDRLKRLITERGYQPVEVRHQTLFDPYFDEMNAHWSANGSFLTYIGWKESYPTFFKLAEGLILCVVYLRTAGYPIAIPCIGHYTKDGIIAALRILKGDFAVFGYPLVMTDVVPWMLPFYEAGDLCFEQEDLRENRDYLFSPEDFRMGMDAQDDRYRYRYFKRKFNYETVEITPEHREECRDFMQKVWCGDMTCDECHCGCLTKVVDNLIPYFDTLRVHGILVRVDGEMAGFSIVSCRNGLGIYQYKNARNRIKGLNEYLLRESFDRYMQSAEVINYTEDMGIPSLRRYKEHMAPHFSLLSKITLTERSIRPDERTKEE